MNDEIKNRDNQLNKEIIIENMTKEDFFEVIDKILDIKFKIEEIKTKNKTFLIGFNNN